MAVFRIEQAVKRTVRVFLSWFVFDQKSHLTSYIDPVVIIVIVLRCDDSVAHEDHGSSELFVGTGDGRAIILLDQTDRRRRRVIVCNFKTVRFSELGLNKNEVLEVAVILSARKQAHSLEAMCQIARSDLVESCGDVASFHFIRSQEIKIGFQIFSPDGPHGLRSGIIGRSTPKEGRGNKREKKQCGRWIP